MQSTVGEESALF